MSKPRGRRVLRAVPNVAKGLLTCLGKEGKTHEVELITIRFGGIAARKRPIGRNAANAFKKSLKLPPPLEMWCFHN